MDIEFVKKNAEHTGKCGKELNWWQLGDELYIEGQGAIDHSAFAGEYFSSVVISYGCTEIGEIAFGYNDSLKSVELPDSLKKIGEDAFIECTSLVLTVPDGVAEIDNDAFFNVDEVIYDGRARPKPNNDNWGAVKWTWNPSLRPQTIAFKCDVCGALNDKPLDINHHGSFDGAVIAVYLRGVNWNNQIPVPQTEMDIIVGFPFCCTVGDEFWSGYKADQFVESRLLSVVESYENSAKVHVLILREVNELSFVKPVSEEVKMNLKEKHEYKYVTPGGDSPTPSIWGSRDRILKLSNTYGGGDLYYSDYIYTDDDGIDHLVTCLYSDGEVGAAFLGDEILGYQSDSYLQWENGLFIDKKKKYVLSCDKDEKEIVVPDGIVSLGWWSFHNCVNLERLTIPDSVTDVYYAFSSENSNIKEIILTGESKLLEKDFPGSVTIIRKP